MNRLICYPTARTPQALGVTGNHEVNASPSSAEKWNDSTDHGGVRPKTCVKSFSIA